MTAVLADALRAALPGPASAATVAPDDLVVVAVGRLLQVRTAAEGAVVRQIRPLHAAVRSLRHSSAADALVSLEDDGDGQSYVVVYHGWRPLDERALRAFPLPLPSPRCCLAACPVTGRVAVGGEEAVNVWRVPIGGPLVHLFELEHALAEPCRRLALLGTLVAMASEADVRVVYLDVSISSSAAGEEEEEEQEEEDDDADDTDGDDPSDDPCVVQAVFDSDGQPCQPLDGSLLVLPSTPPHMTTRAFVRARALVAAQQRLSGSGGGYSAAEDLGVGATAAFGYRSTGQHVLLNRALGVRPGSHGQRLLHHAHLGPGQVVLAMDLLPPVELEGPVPRVATLVLATQRGAYAYRVAAAPPPADCLRWGSADEELAVMPLDNPSCVLSARYRFRGPATTTAVCAARGLLFAVTVAGVEVWTLWRAGAEIVHAGPRPLRPVRIAAVRPLVPADGALAVAGRRGLVLLARARTRPAGLEFVRRPSVSALPASAAREVELRPASAPAAAAAAPDDHMVLVHVARDADLCEWALATAGALPSEPGAPPAPPATHQPTAGMRAQPWSALHNLLSNTAQPQPPLAAEDVLLAFVCAFARPDALPLARRMAGLLARRWMPESPAAGSLLLAASDEPVGAALALAAAPEAYLDLALRRSPRPPMSAVDAAAVLRATSSAARLVALVSDRELPVDAAFAPPAAGGDALLRLCVAGRRSLAAGGDDFDADEWEVEALAQLSADAIVEHVVAHPWLVHPPTQLTGVLRRRAPWVLADVALQLQQPVDGLRGLVRASLLAHLDTPEALRELVELLHAMASRGVAVELAAALRDGVMPCHSLELASYCGELPGWLGVSGGASLELSPREDCLAYVRAEHWEHRLLCALASPRADVEAALALGVQGRARALCLARLGRLGEALDLLEEPSPSVLALFCREYCREPEDYAPVLALARSADLLERLARELPPQAFLALLPQDAPVAGVQAAVGLNAAAAAAAAVAEATKTMAEEEWGVIRA